MFLLVSVCLFMGEGGGPQCDHYAWYIGPHCTGSTPSDIIYGTTLLSCPSLLVTSDGHYWRPIQTFSFEHPPYPRVLTSGGQSTYGWQAGGMLTTECFLVYI